jgi:hypothetical protein
MAKSKAQAAVGRRERWRELLRRWQASGLSQAEFCRRRGIPVWKLAWWKRRLTEEPLAGRVDAESTAPEAPFVPVQRGDRMPWKT